MSRRSQRSSWGGSAGASRRRSGGPCETPCGGPRGRLAASPLGSPATAGEDAIGAYARPSRPSCAGAHGMTAWPAGAKPVASGALSGPRATTGASLGSAPTARRSRHDEGRSSDGGARGGPLGRVAAWGAARRWACGRRRSPSAIRRAHRAPAHTFGRARDRVLSLCSSRVPSSAGLETPALTTSGVSPFRIDRTPADPWAQFPRDRH